jgi:hypothetical protein
LALACFCEDFFWFALGDLSPMVVVCWLGLESLAAPSWSRSAVGILLDPAANVKLQA